MWDCLGVDPSDSLLAVDSGAEGPQVGGSFTAPGRGGVTGEGTRMRRAPLTIADGNHRCFSVPLAS